jgi:two-component system OmpR family sensor kinase
VVSATPPKPDGLAAARPARPARPGQGRPGLAWTTSLVTTAVAAVAVVLAGGVSFNLVRGAAESQARATLGRQAEILAGAPGLLAPANRRIDRIFTQQNIQVVTVTAAGRATGAAADIVTDADRNTLAADDQISTVTRFRGHRVLVEGRSLESGGGVVLVQRDTVVAGVAASARRRVFLALLIGLVGAAVAGVLLTRRLARPLQSAAAAAHRLAAGERDVRVAPAGPAEVAEVAIALNSLAGALQHSEGRQREFLLSVSHELRTPLTAVQGFAEALADGVTTGEQVAPTGEVILAESRRLERLVTDLLDLARLGAEDFRIDLAEIDLAELVRAAGTVWAARCAEAGVTFRLEVPHRPLPMRTDATRVRQIIDGLAENALRVTPAGCPIVLAVRADGEAEVIEVRDGGPGLTDDDCRVAFDRSALYDRYRGVRRVGTGVGLALVAGLAARLGGSASAGRADEGGACFTVRLPRAPATQAVGPRGGD